MHINKGCNHDNIYLRAKSKTSVFATDGIWETFSVVLNFLLLSWTPWVGFQNERLMHECAFITGKNSMAIVERVAIATQFVSATDGIDWSIFFRPSHFKDCVAIAMCLIVALFFPFLIEVCWLLYCVVYPQCKITQLEKQDNQKCFFATDGILEQNSVRRTFKCVATVTCLIMAAPLWCFYGVQWLFIHVIYIKCLDFWLERKDGWKKKFRPSQWWPILDLAP